MLDICKSSLTRIAIAALIVASWITQAQSQTAQQAQPLIEWHAEPKAPSGSATAAPKFEPSLIPAAHLATEAAQPSQQAPALETQSADSRRLAPYSGVRPLESAKSDDQASLLEDSLPQMESLTTAGAGLAIVVGLFLLCAWLFRKSGPKPTTPLPKDAVAVLGRVPLASNHFAHLIKLGNKLVLVSISPDSVTTLAEVSEPIEVQNLLALCMRGHQHSTTAEFQNVLEQLAGEPARGFLDNPTTGASPVRHGRA